MIPLLYLLTPLPLINLVLIPSSHVSLMRNLASCVFMTLQLFPAHSWGRRLGRSIPRLNPLPVRNNPPAVHVATIAVVAVTLLMIAHHQSKRVEMPILPLRMMIHLLNLPMPVTNTLPLFSLLTYFSSARFRFRGCVRF